MIPIVATLLGTLAQNGLGLLSSAIQAKGKEVVEKIKALLAAKVAEENNVSRRWEADMASDSWLSKNIRPGTLLYILTAYLIFAGLSAAGIQVQEAYVSLLGQWGMLVMTAYFGGRTVEKVMEMRKGGDK